MKKRQGESPLKIGPAAAFIGPAVKLGMGLIGGRKRRRALARAQGAYDMQKQRYENMDTSNLYANQENVYEDQTVDQQSAEFLKSQQLQQQSNMMDQFSQAAGGSGIAALAQAMSQQQSQNAQAAAADIRSQEQNIQQNQLAQQAKLNQQAIAGEYQKRDADLGKIETMMNFTGQDLQKAQAEKAMHDQMVVSGIGGLASAGLGAKGFK